MQHFQPILIVIGLLAIGGVLIHGYLLSRKEKNVVTNTPLNVDIFAEKSSSELNPESVDDVISDVRITRADTTIEQEENIDFSVALEDEKIEPIKFSEAPAEEAKFETVKNDAQLDKNEQVATEATQPQDLFIFNVVAKEGLQLGGHELLQFFLTSGFRFGEMSIFHRHQHSDGTGPVLFSIANMMAPGTFNPEEMEQFKSEGVSFFLTAPNENINIKESFELMLCAVEQMAEEFDCLVLNAAREPMTEAQFIEYNHRLLHYI
ncbi:cell division protein ZipA [Psychromonas hadalis]|uniref:cell division protein ZipA n=1 Tax=Psychromonas hadalis TaxID=211669 RepID=UPI0003B4110E|nr:cell division protein ZipA [Psychromonas hadalis]